MNGRQIHIKEGLPETLASQSVVKTASALIMADKSGSWQALIRISLLLLFANPLKAELLPGVDVLSSGFDSAAWTSKGRIFDFKEIGGQVDVTSIGKTYDVPVFLTVITNGPNSKRVEDSCSAVTTTFSEYLRIYQRTTRADIGYFSSDFTLGFQYHLDVQEVHQSITSQGQAIGVSESWWGMYEVVAPPPFLLAAKMDPIFMQTKQYLNTIGIPAEESQQFIYNQVCCGAASFGTHYVGSIIAGARATITTFVNSSFHHEYSNRTVSEQVSLAFTFSKLNLSLSTDAHEVEQQLLEDFKNNSHIRVTYQPDTPEIHASKAPWLTWESAAAGNPTVVNSSVSSLASLFFESPLVMSHMQKTIDFYMANNRAPTLAELQSSRRRSALPPMVPGHQVVGCGFDAASLSTKNCLFEIHADEELSEVWFNPYYPDIKYTVPEGYFVLNTPESLLLNGSIIMETIDDYIQHSIWTETHHKKGFFGFGSKTTTTTTDDYYRMFYAHTYSLALSLRQIAWYTLRLSEFPLPKMNPAFQLALDYLPKVYNSSDDQIVTIYKMFFDAYGTSVVTEADMGGLVWAETWFESCLKRVFSDICISKEVHSGWWIWHETDDELSCDSRLTEDFATYASWHYELLGGTAKVNISEWESWALTVKHDPRPVKMHLVPIFYLLPDTHPGKAALEEATDDYLRRSEQEKQATIEAMTSVRPPPAELCSKYETAANTEEEQLPNEDPRPELCPFVGYHGAYCPSMNGETEEMRFEYSELEQRIANEGLLLPKGVGVSIDVSNGQLKLPVWNFNFQGSTAVWTDPVSQEQYLLPTNLAINADIQHENVITTRVFKSAEELVSVWEQGYAAGNWLGGEFGQSKSVSELYSKFFSQQQATSINQRPQALYRLTLGNNWETQLNRHSLAALKALPEIYDDNIYSRFMDTWGTHVTRDTLVGGMFEQQVLMKSCVWQSPYLTGGLTEEQLKTYLTMDLEKTPPQDSFYSDRRQMNIDHRIGGNPETSDQTQWSSTLAKNPALIKIYSHVEWSEVALRSGAVSAAVVANLHAAIDLRMRMREEERRREREEVERRRIEELQGPRPVIAVKAHGRRGDLVPQMETGTYLTMNGFASCPAGLPIDASKAYCNTGLYIESWNVHHLIEPLRYERNAQGDMSSIRCFDLDNVGNCIHHSGPFVRNGCSLMPRADGTPRNFHEPVPDRTVVAMVCADCQVMSATFAQDAILRCVCPGYTAKQQHQVGGYEGGRIKERSDDDCYDTHQAGGMPNLKQCDPRWRCSPYAGHDQNSSSCSSTSCSENNICISGCGIVSTTMVLSYFAHEDMSPVIMADWLMEKGYRDDLSNVTGATCNGVSHSAICAAAQGLLGLTCEQSNSFQQLDLWLQQGHPVIAHVRHRPQHHCKFTSTGHYIVVVKKHPEELSSYVISDPNSCDPEKGEATQEDLQQDCQLVGFIHIYEDSKKANTKIIETMQY